MKNNRWQNITVVKLAFLSGTIFSFINSLFALSVGFLLSWAVGDLETGNQFLTYFLLQYLTLPLSLAIGIVFLIFLFDRNKLRKTIYSVSLGVVSVIVSFFFIQMLILRIVTMVF